jgi:Fe-S-cluster containining protein
MPPWFKEAPGHCTITAMSEMSEVNVCQPCGACCAHFRVSFYWAEADDTPGGFVPAQLTEQLTPHLRCMQGTSQKAPRCTTLDGEVGQWVACRIYEHRPTPCREVMPGNAQCLKARAAHGMGPLPDAF